MWTDDGQDRIMKLNGFLLEVLSGWDLAEWLERLTANAEVATVLGSVPASSKIVESEGRCLIEYMGKPSQKNHPVNFKKISA